MGTIEGSLPGVITSSVISTTAPSARAVTCCAIGNAYGGLPSNLMFPMDRSLLHLPLLLTAGTPRRSGHRRALPLADLPQPPRSLHVLCLGARRPLLLVKEVCPAHVRNVWRGGKPYKGFCSLLRATCHRPEDRHPQVRQQAVIAVEPCSTSPGWKQFAVTPVPSRRRASSI